MKALFRVETVVFLTFLYPSVQPFVGRWTLSGSGSSIFINTLGQNVNIESVRVVSIGATQSGSPLPILDWRVRGALLNLSPYKNSTSQNWIFSNQYPCFDVPPEMQLNAFQEIEFDDWSANFGTTSTADINLQLTIEVTYH